MYHNNSEISRKVGKEDIRFDPSKRKNARNSVATSSSCRCLTFRRTVEDLGFSFDYRARSIGLMFLRKNTARGKIDGQSWTALRAESWDPSRKWNFLEWVSRLLIDSRKLNVLERQGKRFNESSARICKTLKSAKTLMRTSITQPDKQTFVRWKSFHENGHFVELIVSSSS